MPVAQLSSAQKLLFLLLVLLLALAYTKKAHAAAYMKLGDIKGDVSGPHHSNWINLDSVALPASMNQAITAAPQAATSELSATSQTPGRYSSKRQHKPISITKPVDKSSGSLQKAAEQGQVFKQATLDTVDPGDPTQPIRIELENVRVTSYQTSGSGSSASRPMENFSLNYEEIKFIKLPKPKTAR